MQRREWPTLAAWFDESQGDEGDLWHRTLIYPGILKVIGQVTGREILDVGCGNGSLVRILARMENRVTGTDGSAPNHRARESARGQKSAGRDLSRIGRGRSLHLQGQLVRPRHHLYGFDGHARRGRGD